VGCDPYLTEDLYKELLLTEESKYTCILCTDRLGSLISNSGKHGTRPFRQMMVKEKKVVVPPLMKRKSDPQP
jgi:hypothetical protein